jgi:hypothetical protein
LQAVKIIPEHFNFFSINGTWEVQKQGILFCFQPISAAPEKYGIPSCSGGFLEK